MKFFRKDTTNGGEVVHLWAGPFGIHVDKKYWWRSQWDAGGIKFRRKKKDKP